MTQPTIFIPIPVTKRLINGAQVSTCSARDLHEYFKVKRDFVTWIKERIRVGGFILDADYIVTECPRRTVSGHPMARTQKRVDYQLSIIVVQYLAMTTHTDEARRNWRAFITERVMEEELPVSNVTRFSVPACWRFLMARRRGRSIKLETAAQK